MARWSASSRSHGASRVSSLHINKLIGLSACRGRQLPNLFDVPPMQICHPVLRSASSTAGKYGAGLEVPGQVVDSFDRAYAEMRWVRLGTHLCDDIRSPGDLEP